MMKKWNYLRDYFKYLENPISCLLFKFKFKKNVSVKFKNSDKIIHLNKPVVLNNLMGMLPYLNDFSDEFLNFIEDLNSEKKIISWAGINIFNYTEVDLYGAHVVFFEYFNRGYWSDFGIDFKNRCVIDIGAHIGDSAFYFSSKGATVYAFEPIKYLHELSLRIKEINPELQEKIYFFNKGVSDKQGHITIGEMDSVSSYLKDDVSYSVEVLNIETILEDNNLKPDILKMDCEGCEFNIILNSNLSEFNDIIFEHHSKICKQDYMLLIDKLKSQGFKITLLNYGDEKFSDMGLIHAFK